MYVDFELDPYAFDYTGDSFLEAAAAAGPIRPGAFKEPTVHELYLLEEQQQQQTGAAPT